MSYKLLASGGVQRLVDNASIPSDPDNLDWVAYQAWLNAGNAALPADAPTAAQINAPVMAALAQSDEKMLRALEEGDPARIAQRRAEREALRAKLVK